MARSFAVCPHAPSAPRLGYDLAPRSGLARRRGGCGDFRRRGLSHPSLSPKDGQAVPNCLTPGAEWDTCHHAAGGPRDSSCVNCGLHLVGTNRDIMGPATRSEWRCHAVEHRSFLAACRGSPLVPAAHAFGRRVQESILMERGRTAGCPQRTTCWHFVWTTRAF